MCSVLVHLTHVFHCSLLIVSTCHVGITTLDTGVNRMITIYLFIYEVRYKQVGYIGRRVNYTGYAEHQCLYSATYSWLRAALSVALVTYSSGRCVSSSSSSCSSSSSAVAAAAVRELVAVLATDMLSTTTQLSLARRRGSDTVCQ